MGSDLPLLLGAVLVLATSGLTARGSGRGPDD